MTKKVVIIGAASNAKLAHYYFTNDSPHQVVAFAVEEAYKRNDTFCNLPLIGLNSLKSQFPPEEFQAFVAVGYTDMNDVRKRLYDKIKSMGYSCPNYISSKCSFLTDEAIGDNNLILEDNTIQPFVKIGSNNVLWSGNHVGHDVHIKNHCFITSHVVISGFTVIEDNCFLGVNATLRDDITIAFKTLIGAGASVMKSSEEGDVLLAPKPFAMDKKSWEIKIS